VAEISPPLDEAADVRRIVCEVDNRTRLLEPMTYTNVEIEPASHIDCLAVPLSAMVDGGNDKVFVVDDEGILHRKRIVTGASDGRYIEIVSGISAGDIVVTSNLDGLKDGMKVEPIIGEEEG